MKRNLMDELSIINGLNKSILTDILKSISVLISQYYYEMKLNKEEELEVNLGFGNLIIDDKNGSVSFKFIPSKDFLKDLGKGEQNNFNTILNENLITKLQNYYKGLIDEE